MVLGAKTVHLLSVRPWIERLNYLVKQVSHFICIKKFNNDNKYYNYFNQQKCGDKNFKEKVSGIKVEVFHFTRKQVLASFSCYIFLVINFFLCDAEKVPCSFIIRIIILRRAERRRWIKRFEGEKKGNRKRQSRTNPRAIHREY